jgi:hypothetical protein
MDATLSLRSDWSRPLSVAEDAKDQVL